MHIKVKSQKSKETKPQLYHGHTTIELKNVHTGSRERIEDDNTFTTGINGFLGGLGIFNNSPYVNSMWRGRQSWQNLIGGIFLFDSEIQDVNGVYPTIMPAGTKMIANGSYGVTNNGNPTEMGSFNASESSANSTSIVQVYDWSTSQGNGDISCVCLTSSAGGYIGYGNSVSNTSHATKRTLDYEQNHETLTLSGTANSGTAGIDGDTIYCVTSVNTSEFTYTKRKYPIIHVNLLGEFAETEAVSIPSSLVISNIAPSVMYIGNGRFLVLPFKRLQAGVSATVGIYDESQDMWSYINFTVPSTVTYTFDMYTSYCGVVDGEFFTIADASGHRIIVNWDGSIDDGSMQGFKFAELDDNLILASAWYNAQSSPVYIIDKVNNTSYYTNGQIDASNLFSFSHDRENKFFVLNKYGTGSVNTVTAYRNPLYLATVNNISPVQKTASQTMKVIYTVTPA